MKITRNDLKKDNGQALVEFALIVPILLFLIVAVIDFGWLFMAQIRVTNAAREAARYYAVHKDTGSTKDLVIATLTPIAKESIGSLDSYPDVNVTFPAGTKVSVYVSADVSTLTGFFFDPNVPIPIKAEAHMRVEYD